MDQEKVMKQRRLIEFGQVYADMNHREAKAELEKWHQKKEKSEGKMLLVSEWREMGESIDKAEYDIEKWQGYMRLADEMLANFDAEHNIDQKMLAEWFD